MTADSDQNITANINRSGGVDLNTRRDIAVGGDVTGRDKITQIINNFFQGDTAQRDLRNRRNMLERVKNDWVKGVLEKSLYHEMMLDLGLEERPGEVQHPWDMTLQIPNRENRALPPGTKIMQVFDEMNHALLILGEPGSGKTTMLLELARDTIARAEQDLIQPIPVVFNLSSWADPKQSIADWLVRELHDKYGVHKKIAQPWIDNDDLLLLLDGLDEVKAERREECVKAINDFRSEHGQTQLVVCSRVADYKGLATQLKLDGAILIQPLMTQQIDEYLERAGNELAAVHEALRHDAELQELAQSPLMLGVMTLAYRGVSKDAITGGRISTIWSRRKHLFDAYTQQMFNRVARVKNAPYPKQQTMCWLTWLAQRMTEHGQSVFLLDQMPLSWLPTRKQRLYKMLVTTVAVAIVSSVSLPGLLLVLGSAGLVLGLGFGLVVGVYVWEGRLGQPSSWRPIALKWAWKEGWRELIAGFKKEATLYLKTALILAFLVGLFAWWEIDWSFGLRAGLFVGLVIAGFGLFVGMLSGLYGLAGGLLAPKELEVRMTPYQGIRQSVKNALIVGLLGGVLGESMGGILYVMAPGLRAADGSIEPALVLFGALWIALLTGLPMGLRYGGLTVLSHFTLRFILYRNGDMPWNYVRFLDYAADRIFLRKVGGGYIFIHRMVMEYFASLETEPNAGSNE